MDGINQGEEFKSTITIQYTENLPSSIIFIKHNFINKFVTLLSFGISIYH